MRAPSVCAATLGVALVAGANIQEAHAQSSPFLRGEIPFDYDRGRNTSVLERSRPEYATPGIPAGGFTLRPQVSVNVNATDNVYSVPTDKTGDVFFTISPEVRAASNWSRHRLSVEVGGEFRRFASETLKNENGWYGRLAGRVELGIDTTIDATARTEKLYETRFSTASSNNIQSSVPYRVTEGRVLVQNSRGRFRLAASADYATYDFQPVSVFDGTVISQDNRDRDIVTGAGLAEYAVSPDTALFAQLTYEKVDYGQDLSVGVANRDSNTVRALAGASLDVTALIRGRIGAGYTVRSYDSSLYTDVKGLSLEAQLEYFPSELTTVGLFVRRRADDAATQGLSGYLGTTSTLRIDHELLRNLILTLRGDYEQGNYRGSDGSITVYRANASARYLFSPNVTFGFNLDYGKRENEGTRLGPSFSEVRGGLSAQLRL
jgi:hypothetical protein